MGISYSAGINVQTNNVQTQILNESNQECIITNVSDVTNTAVVASNLTVEGDFTGISNGFSTDSSCAIVNSMESTIDLTQQNVKDLDATVDTSLFTISAGIGISAETNNIKNAITSVNQSLCTINNEISVSNSIVYFSDGTVGNDFVGISQQSNPSSSCSLSNTSKSVSLADLLNKNDSKVTFTGTLNDMVNALRSVFIVGIIAAIIFGVIFIIIKISTSKKKSKAENNDQQPINQPYIDQQPINQQPIDQQPINEPYIEQQPINEQPINEQLIQENVI